MRRLTLEWLERAHEKLVAAGRPFSSADVRRIALDLERYSWMPWDSDPRYWRA